MQPICARGCTYVQGSCYCGCPTNTIVANEDPTKCYPIVGCTATPDLLSDPVFDLVCNKVGVPIGTGCAAGYTQWRTGYCYVDCPPQYLENGLTCIKKSVGRQLGVPRCRSSLMWYDGIECSYNPLAIFILFFISGFLIWLWLRSKF